MSLDNVISTVTKIWTRQSRVQFPARAKNFSLLQNIQSGSGTHPASHSMGIVSSSPRSKSSQSVKLTTHIHPLPRLISGVTPLLQLHAFMTCTRPIQLLPSTCTSNKTLHHTLDTQTQLIKDFVIYSIPPEAKQQVESSHLAQQVNYKSRNSHMHSNS